MKIDDQISRVISLIENELREKLLAGRRFSLQIEGVRSKVNAVRTSEIHKTDCGFNQESRELWITKQH